MCSLHCQETLPLLLPSLRARSTSSAPFISQSLRPRIRKTLRNQEANVVLAGQIYSDALAALYQAVEGDPNAVVLSSYDDAVLWKGHTSMVEEMKSQAHRPPDAIFCAVGGGGLMGGILLRCQLVGWDNVPVVALETHGSNCFYNTISLNTRGFSSKVSSLPKSIPPEAPYTVWISEGHQVAIPHMHDHKFLIKLACSTAMSPAYNRELFWHILDPTKELLAEERRKKSVIFVVCGGVKVTADELWEYAQVLDQAAETEWKIKWDRIACWQINRVP